MFKKILIANRGEIACRIIRTAKKLGIRTVGVFSEADAGARHVRMADEALLIGPAPARDSYLAIGRIINAARRSGAQAIHPGYGFLSENGDFAEACQGAGLEFIGPGPSAIRAMGSKSAAKQLMAGAGLPLVPGYHGDDQGADHLGKEAGRIGYPVLIKPSAGGGGKGMRIVLTDTEFPAALAASQREAASSFGDSRVLLEKYLERPRHVEVQVFGDRHGNLVYLHDRDCSIQRRYQKIIEEAPAPGLDAHTRRLMGEAAIKAARAVGYTGAGTVEFIVDQAGHFYFMEMNTRLQVEHPVTEMITGQDLVEWQIRVAAGERLPLAQEMLSLQGHAIEARIYAEDPDQGFLPSTGRITHLALPAESRHVRVDSGVEQGDEVSAFYDPMIAKVIVWDVTRDHALARMSAALGEFRLAGLTSNVEFLHRLISLPPVQSGDVNTQLIEHEQAILLPADRPAIPGAAFQAAAVAALLLESRIAQDSAAAGAEPNSPWDIPDAWRLGPRPDRKLSFLSRDKPTVVTARRDGSSWLLLMNGTVTPVSGQFGTDGWLRVWLGDRLMDVVVAVTGREHHVFLQGRHFCLTLGIDQDIDTIDVRPDGDLVSLIPGRIVALLVSPGTCVEKGDPLLILEAMKMEHTIVSPAAGTVVQFHYAVNEQVEAGVELLEFAPLGLRQLSPVLPGAGQ